MTARYLRRPEPVFSEVGDELAILDLRSEQYHSVGPVGACVWEALSEPRTIEELVQLVTDEFDVAESDAGADIAVFVEQLVQAGLAEVQSG